MKAFRSPITLYAGISGFILGWWLLAFSARQEVQFPTLTPKEVFISPQLSPLNREQLRQALSGDFNLMTSLMTEWETDAKILNAPGHPQFLRGQLLGRQLKQKHSDKKFLPQTFVSASFLLALASPNEIAALPKAMREQKHIYSNTDQVPLNIDRYNHERIYQIQPDAAFVAHYSHPATLGALRRQRMPLYFFNALHSIQDLTLSLTQLGAVVDRSEEAELLKIFIESALLAIDNRYSKSNAKILYLTHRSHYSSPTSPLTQELLKRLNIEYLNLPFLDREQISHLKPDALIVSSEFPLSRTPFECPVYCVDDAVQQSANQYIVLAYYDLYVTASQL